LCVGFTPVCINVSISVIFSVIEVNTWFVRSEIFGRIFEVHHCIVSNQWQRWRRKRRIHGNTEIYNKQNVSLKLVLNWFTSTYRFGSMVFNATFNNISAISWRLSKGSCVLWPIKISIYKIAMNIFQFTEIFLLVIYRTWLRVIQWMFHTL
jgi:hypothetical protein